MLAISPVPALAASAGSVAFVRDGDLFRVSADGSLLQRLTTDGAAAGYTSPSQSDDGRLLALRGGGLVRLAFDGNALPAPQLPPDGGRPVAVRVSPNGAMAAVLTEGGCPDVATTVCRRVLVLPVAGGAAVTAAAGGSELAGMTWSSDATLIVARGAVLQEVSLAGSEPVTRSVTDAVDGALSDPDATATGLAAVRTSSAGAAVRLFGPAPAAGTTAARCEIAGAGIARPSWAPGGREMAWQADFGIVRGGLTASGCSDGTAELLVAGAREPDWGPATLRVGVGTVVETGTTAVPRVGRLATQVAVVNAGPGPRLSMRLRVAGRVTVRVERRVRGGFRVTHRATIRRKPGVVRLPLGRLVPGRFRILVRIAVPGASVATLPTINLLVRGVPS